MIDGFAFKMVKNPFSYCQHLYNKNQGGREHWTVNKLVPKVLFIRLKFKDGVLLSIIIGNVHPFTRRIPVNVQKFYVQYIKKL